MWHTDFGITKEGEKAHRFLLTNNRGMCVELSDFGALVLSVYVLDRHGRNRDVVLGYDNLTDYYNQVPQRDLVHISAEMLIVLQELK